MKQVIGSLLFLAAVTGFVLMCGSTDNAVKDQAIDMRMQPLGFPPVRFNQYPTQATLRYVRDPRTNICFAYLWGGDFHGGPAMTMVPCETVRYRVIDIP